MVEPFVQNGGAVFSIDGVGVGDGMAQFLKKALRIEGPQLTQKTITIRYEIRHIYQYKFNVKNL